MSFREEFLEEYSKADDNRKKELAREYRKAYKRRQLESKKNYCKTHRKEINERQRNFYHRLRMKVFEKLGNKCVHCGFLDIRALQIDHVHGGGTQELRALQYNDYLRKVLKDTEGNYQLLCANCNSIKRVEQQNSPFLK